MTDPTPNPLANLTTCPAQYPHRRGDRIVQCARRSGHTHEHISADGDEWETAYETATATLDVVTSGLDPDQEIRARAIALAIDALARVDLPLLPLPAPGPGAYLLDLQQVFTTLIRDGAGRDHHHR